MADSAFSARSIQSSVSGREGPIPVKPKDYPKASESALEFLEFINEEDFQDILFEDNLAVTVSDNNVGEFVTRVSLANKHHKDCFLVYASSNGVIEGVQCGTSVTTYVSKRLETLEQHHHEYVQLENHPMEKKSSIVLQDGEYVVSWTSSQGDATIHRHSVTYGKEYLQGFISEGSNLLLQRLLIKKGVPANFSLLAFDTDNNLCKSPYKSLPEKSQGVEDQFVLVKGIERSIISPVDLPTAWQSFFDGYGHLMSRVQVGSPVIMQVTGVPEPITEDTEPAKPTFPKVPLSWEEDLELNSKFVDKMDELKDDHLAYMRKHPELKAMISDYVQYLLIKKPDDILNFSAKYFASYSKRMVKPPSYETSEISNPFPSDALKPTSP